MNRLVLNSGGMGSYVGLADDSSDSSGIDLSSVPVWLWFVGAGLLALMWLDFNSDSSRSIRRTHRGGLLA